MIKRTGNLLLMLVVTYLCIELVCFLFMKFKFKSAQRPDFHYTSTYTKYDFPFAEINKDWGMWHYPEKHIESRPCFNVEYAANSYGARDEEREKIADSNRIVLLGDSFMEGYGLDTADRFSNQLQSLVNKPVMNFACGYFTPTQEMLVYKKLASDFSHNAVIIGILPFNDFAEDDTSFHEKDGFVHYQPYLEGSYPDYHLIYREDSISKSTFNKEGYLQKQNTSSEKRNRLLKSFTYWYNLYHYLSALKSRPAQPSDYSGYFDYTSAQIEKLSYILAQIKSIAGTRQVYVVSIPVKQDFIRAKNAIAPLPEAMRDICKMLDMGYLDLLEVYKNSRLDPASLYLECDGHWNEKANRIAAQKVVDLLRK